MRSAGSVPVEKKSRQDTAFRHFRDPAFEHRYARSLLASPPRKPGSSPFLSRLGPELDIGLRLV